MKADSSLLVVGIGNTECGDDGCGPAVAERLRAAGPSHIRTASLSGDLTRLLELWRDAEHVVLVDMVRSEGQPSGSMRRFDLTWQPLPYDVDCSSHGVNLSQVVELGRALNELPERLELLGIVGSTTTPGTGLTPEVATAVDRATALLLQLNPFS